MIQEMPTELKNEPKIVVIDMSDFGKFVSDSTVGFLRLLGSEGVDGAVCAGSGVLISVGSIFGILTAAHVICALPKKGKVGILTFPRLSRKLQNFHFEMDGTFSVVLSGKEWSQEGPDIGFLRLPIDVAGTLKSSNNFKNLDIATQSFSTEEEPTTQFVDAVCGVIDEKTQTVESASPQKFIKKFEAYFMNGQSTPIGAKDDLDYCLFTPNGSPNVPMPNSFEGTSGGGLWRMYWKLDADGKATPKEIRLCGIAYFQSGQVGNTRILTCHGPMSVYRAMRNRIREKWPNETSVHGL
jgi:hypothetical protein